MIDIMSLFICVLTLFLLMLPGIFLRKTRIVGKDELKPINQLLIYVGNIALIISTFIQPFRADVFKDCLWVLLFSFIAHTLFTVAALLLFRKSERGKRDVRRFGMVFSNAVFMGLPVITTLINKEAGIYASFYNVFFQIFVWSVGAYLYTGDRKYISLKKIIVNPGVIPLIIGLTVYLTGIGGYIPTVVSDALSYLAGLVFPISMIIVGMRLADCDFHGIFREKGFFLSAAMRLLLLPAAVWLIMKLLTVAGLDISRNVMISVVACSSTPSASFTVAFAERYNGDGAEASKLVSLTTLLSVGTMPLIALLLNL